MVASDMQTFRTRRWPASLTGSPYRRRIACPADEGANMRQFTVLLGLIGTLALALAATAGATPPTTETFHDEGSMIDTELCGFAINASFEVDDRITTFYDSAGDPIRVVERVTFLGTLTNGDKSVVDNDNWVVVHDLVGGTDIFLGTVFNINVPGEGIVVLDAGRVIFDAETGEILFEGGPHQALHGEGDFEAICDYLADP